MALNSDNIERLRKLRRTLPKTLPSSNSKKKPNTSVNPSLHPIETEENPQKLFKELIKASPDGEIPPHLIERLKKTESLALEREAHSKNNTNSRASTHEKSNQQNDFSNNSSQQTNDLYVSFKRLLLEED